VISHGITVVSSEGEVLDVIVLDDQALPTNCCFDDNALWVTDFGVDWRQGAPIGRLWRIETDAVGRPQYRGRL
jgi:sugar lactone lactonase YvrE